MPRLIGVKMPKGCADARRSAEPCVRHVFRLDRALGPVSLTEVTEARSPGALTQCLVRHPFPRGRCCAVWDSPPAISLAAVNGGANERRLAETAPQGTEYFDLCIRLALSAATQTGHETGEGRSCRACNETYQRSPQVLRSWRLPPVATPSRSRRFWGGARGQSRGLPLVAASSQVQPWGPQATSSIVRPHRRAADLDRHPGRARSIQTKMKEDHRCISAPVVFLWKCH